MAVKVAGATDDNVIKRKLKTVTISLIPLVAESDF